MIEMFDPPENQQVCGCCGQKIRKLNKHTMDRSKVAMLELLGKVGGWTIVKSGRIQKFRGDEQVHCMRLEWFGLVEHHPKRRSAMYRITPDGMLFLRGMHVVPKSIWCRDGVVFETDPVMVAIGSIKGVVLDKEYWDTYPVHGQKYG